MQTTIRPLLKEEQADAIRLSFDTYVECGKNDYDESGLEGFRSFICDKDKIAELSFIGAFHGGRLIGVLAFREKDCHVSLFFVHPGYHRKGVGRDLFRALTDGKEYDVMTVNSSTYAVPFYESLGFRKLGEAQSCHGLVSVPMERKSCPNRTDMNVIETERLILRPWREDDAPALFRYASDLDVGPVAGWPPHTSVENSLEIIRTVFAAPETYAVVLKDTDEPVGCCGIMRANSQNSVSMKSDEAEIGYWIGKPFWGQGLIPEAVRALLARCFSELSVSTVWCVYYDGNNKSRRVCEKCGFTYHHTNDAVISPLGDERTEHFCRMTRQEYQAFISLHA